MGRWESVLSEHGKVREWLILSVQTQPEVNSGSQWRPKTNKQRPTAQRQSTPINCAILPEGHKHSFPWVPSRSRFSSENWFPCEMHSKYRSNVWGQSCVKILTQKLGFLHLSLGRHFCHSHFLISGSESSALFRRVRHIGILGADGRRILSCANWAEV